MNILFFFTLLAQLIFGQAFTPVPADSQDATDVDFRKVAVELARQDLSQAASISTGNGTGYRIAVSSAGIQFSDGSVLTSTSQIMTTANITGSTLNVQGNLILGPSLGSGWLIPIASGTVVNISTLTLVITSSESYRLRVNSRLMSAAAVSNPYIVFNQLGTHVYPSTAIYVTTNNCLAAGAASTNMTSEMYLPMGVENAHANNVGTGQISIIEFDTVYNTSATVHGIVSYKGTTSTSSDGPVICNNSFSATRQSALTDLKFFFAGINEGAGGATWSGEYYLWKVLK